LTEEIDCRLWAPDVIDRLHVVSVRGYWWWKSVQGLEPWCCNSCCSWLSVKRRLRVPKIWGFPLTLKFDRRPYNSVRPTHYRATLWSLIGGPISPFNWHQN